MRRACIAVTLATSGLLVSWLGQGIWRDSPDAVWAGVAVLSVLSAGAIALETRISRLLAAVVGVRPHDVNSRR